ncbi:TRAP transporter large permease [Leucobacter triazinivorans]|uniref:TRAP transporter large permease subunit n=1 Tax=Leucobacter triazinivorans TaxID=1784719 RepID=A0A4P6KI60_9MICO|nr:TRAP transporter large permease subunit [Leucobacter triazinivorans]QBE49254.1 TRAP transporter large permease subunit [Leucobacter triazinivorans]
MLVTLIVLTIVVLLIVLLMLRMPVALSLALSGALGLGILQGTGYTTNVLGSVPFSATASFSLTIIPMFILMGMFAMRARIAEHVFAVANHMVSRFPGGLGVATVMACAGFSAVSGSSIGTAATMSKLSVGQMRAYGYPAALATGIVAIAGTLGVVIPPSTFLVLYAIMTGESVAQILAAGIIPGLLSALGYIVYILVVGHRQIVRPDATLADAVAGARADAAGAARKSSGGSAGAGAGEAQLPPGTPDTEAVQQVYGRTLRTLPWRGLVRLCVIFLIILGGMFSGVFTSTESAAIAAFVALVILLWEFRRDGWSTMWGNVKGALLDTAQTTSMVFMILVGSSVFSTFLIAAHVPDTVTAWVAGLDVPPLLTIGLLLLLLLPLGAALDEISVLIITIPIIYPIAMELGFHGIWLGLMIVKLTAIGMVTPPVGMTCFVVSGATGIRTETVFKGVLPLMLMDVVVSAILFFVPAITLFLPALVAQGAG